jgi:hypothetical protein
MKIRHHITIDRGSGPVSFVEMEKDGVTRMLRIMHEARFDKAKEVDTVATREALSASADLGQATTKISDRISVSLTAEVLAWCMRNGDRHPSMRWDGDGTGILFESDAAAAEWDASSDRPLVEPPKRRRIVG